MLTFDLNNTSKKLFDELISRLMTLKQDDKVLDKLEELKDYVALLETENRSLNSELSIVKQDYQRLKETHGPIEDSN
jgi:predicted nuclease with TOPRIM domain